MKPLLTSDLKVKFLGLTPVLSDKTGVLNPQQIIGLSSQATFKGKSIKNLIKDIEKSGESLDQKIKKILQRSSLRGHASLSTTPAICLTYEGSKMLDSALTGMIFSSSLMASGRRTQTTESDIVYPEGIFKNKQAKKIYEQISKNIIQTFNYFLSKGVKKDEVSKILQYGIYGTGIIHLPIETVVGFKKEYLMEKDWMPEEVGILLKEIEKKFKKWGLDRLYTTREAAPRNIYPYPNIFKDPAKGNLARELRKKKGLLAESVLIFLESIFSPGLKKRLASLETDKKATFNSFKKVKGNWLGLLNEYQEILRDYNLSIRLKILSLVPWRVWGEKKRHRTCFQIVESIYYCTERASQVFDKFKNRIEKKKIDKNLIKEIEKVFSIPPTFKNNQELLREYLLAAKEAFEAYQKLIKLKIKPKEAVFLIPRGVKIDIFQEYDLYNLLTGYYPLRLCQTAEEEMYRNTWQEVRQIKKTLKEKEFEFLNKFIVPKCQIMGFCPEVKSCSLILSAVKNYDDKFHKEMGQELEKIFNKNLKNLGKDSILGR